MLKSILAEQKELDKEEVQIVRFGKICDTLGPWDFKYQDGKFVGILENVALHPKIADVNTGRLSLCPEVVFSSCYKGCSK